MKKMQFLIFMGMMLAALLALPQASGAGLDIKMDKIFELGKEGLLFSGIDSVCEDAQQNVYVLDRMASKIFKFSKDSKLLLSFGSKGQGPGEFQAPHNVYVVPDGNVIVSEDRAFVSFFNSEGQFIERLTAEKGLALTYLNDNVFYAWVWSEGGRTQLLVNKDGNTLNTFFSEYDAEFSVSAPDESGRLVRFNFATPAITPSFLFERFEDRFLIAKNNRYEISLYDSKGTLLSTIKRDIKPEKLSSRERDFLLSEMKEERDWPDWIMTLIRKNIAKTKTYFDTVLLSEKLIFVFRVHGDLTDSTGGFPVDVFSVDGEFLGSTNLPAQPLYISDAFMYAAVYDEADNLLLQKYQYKIVK